MARRVPRTLTVLIKLLTRLVSQLSRGLLKLVALYNVIFILFTLDVSHALISVSKTVL